MSEDEKSWPPAAERLQTGAAERFAPPAEDAVARAPSDVPRDAPAADASPGLDAWGWIFLLLGLGAIANAVWMLVGPMHWYEELPAAVPDTGPFNPHFVRDIGCAFLAVGLAQVWAAFARRFRVPLAAVAALFLAAHAGLHVYDTSVGNLSSDHWWLDVPGVYLPGAVMLVGAIVAIAREGGESDEA